MAALIGAASSIIRLVRAREGLLLEVTPQQNPKLLPLCLTLPTHLLRLAVVYLRRRALLLPGMSALPLLRLSTIKRGLATASYAPLKYGPHPVTPMLEAALHPWLAPVEGAGNAGKC